MSNSALNQGVLQAKVNNVQNVGDSSAVCSTTGDWSFKNATATATNVFISNAGNVGIGTTSPGRKLDIVGTDNTPSVRFTLPANTNGAWQGIEFIHGAFLKTSIRSFSTGANEQGALAFLTAPAGDVPTERMRIDASGNLLVGTTSSSTLVHVVYGRDANGLQDAHGVFFRAPGAGSRQYIGFLTDDTNGWAGFKATKDGGASGNTIRLYAGGTYATFTAGSSSWSFVSDRNLKNNIVDLSYGLNEVLKLKPVKFSYITDKEATEGKNLGFIAQDVQEVLPELVKTMPEGTLTLAQTEMVAVLVKAIQEQQAQIEALKAEVAALKAS